MSALISLEKIYLAYGGDPLLDHVDFQIHPGERVCLIGRNGAGKSSFLKVIDGIVLPDSGKIHRESSLHISRLEQELPLEADLTVYEIVAQAFNNHPAESWQAEQWIEEVITRLELNGEDKLAKLSGGWQRRVALARALVTRPNLLLLDEPTNHLDIDAIQWLEEKLLQFEGGILFITHDRSLLRRLATRIIELDRGYLTSWPGDYENFLRRKEELLSAEAKLNKEFDKKLAEEERWIRQGIKARRTRNEGRVRALKAMRDERRQRREIVGKVNLEINDAKESGKIVVEVEHISHSFNNKVVIKDFSLRIMRGDRIGLLGPNGIGKTTLLNILLGKLNPQKGTVKLGTKIDIAYFDQLRATLDPEKTILDNVAGGRSSITINGKERHIVSYLSDFLFSSQRLNTPVKALSGGECNRLVLAQLFSLPANILVMDEPTNDLDIETLELLEELLSQFSGTLLLVSHDRTFLDNIVTSTLVFEGEGIITEYVGGYNDWLASQTQTAKSTPIKTSLSVEAKPKIQKTQTLDFKERKELQSLPAKLEKLEKQQQELFAQMAEPNFYQQSTEIIDVANNQLKRIENEIEKIYTRWEELENRA